MTNNGSLLQELEKRLAEHLGVKHVICVANGSIALQVAYKALNLKGEVVTTPFSFAATTSTLVWENLTPVFTDIDVDSFNIDAAKIEALITEKTSAILPVHVFGNPCEVEVIQSIADRRNLKVIYDAAHAFGVAFKGKSVLGYGNASTVSFHATKLFHTIEGGAIITDDDSLAEKIRLLINFGITSPLTIESIGTNGKMNEFEAAMGLCLLDEIDVIKSKREIIWETYLNELSDLVTFQRWHPESHNNFAYAPVLFESEEKLLAVESFLKTNGVLARRYFYPSLDTLPYLIKQKPCAVSRDIASRILCLPIYPSLPTEDLAKIIEAIKVVH